MRAFVNPTRPTRLLLTGASVLTLGLLLSLMVGGSGGQSVRELASTCAFGLAVFALVIYERGQSAAPDSIEGPERIVFSASHRTRGDRVGLTVTVTRNTPVPASAELSRAVPVTHVATFYDAPERRNPLRVVQEDHAAFTGGDMHDRSSTPAALHLL